ncbi:MAG: hypothetical protein AB2693_31840 [Candidatus Thiodiazotropha sp.]
MSLDVSPVNNSDSKVENLKVHSTLFLADGVSFVKTLTRNVLCLWDEVSSPGLGNSSLFSQSGNEAVSRDISNLTDLTNHDTRSVIEYRIAKPKPRKQLVFDKTDKCADRHAGLVKKGRGNAPNAEDIKYNGLLPYHQMNNLFSPRTLAERTNRYGGSVKRLSLILGLKNYTFPLFRPMANFDSSLSSVLKALSLTGPALKSTIKSDQPLLTLQDRNNNSFPCLQENNNPDRSLKDDTTEFENDIKFLSTEPNKTSTPIKSVSPNIKQEKSANSYERLAQNFLNSEPAARKNLLVLSRSASVARKNLRFSSSSAIAAQKNLLTASGADIATQKSWLTANLQRVFYHEKLPKPICNTVKSPAPFFHCDFECINNNHQLNHLDPPCNLPNQFCEFSPYSNLEPSSSVVFTDRRTPMFSSEDEEAVYYLMTKYLND